MTSHAEDPLISVARDLDDLDSYLLHPPPSQAEVDRRERLRRRVYVGSILVAVVIAVWFLAPRPSGLQATRTPQIDSAHEAAATSPLTTSDITGEAATLPRRLDAPSRRARTPDQRSARRPSRAGTRRGQVRQEAIAARPRVVAPRPTARPTQPTQPPPSSSMAAPIVPVG